MNIKQIFLFVLGLGLIINTYGQENKVLEYRVNGLAAKKAYLLSVKGNTYDAQDSCTIQNGLIRFTLPDSMEAGMYRMVFADSLFTDVIINHEDIRMENDL